MSDLRQLEGRVTLADEAATLELGQVAIDDVLDHGLQEIALARKVVIQVAARYACGFGDRAQREARIALVEEDLDRGLEDVACAFAPLARPRRFPALGVVLLTVWHALLPPCSAAPPYPIHARPYSRLQKFTPSRGIPDTIDHVGVTRYTPRDLGHSA